MSQLVLCETSTGHTVSVFVWYHQSFHCVYVSSSAHDSLYIKVVRPFEEVFIKNIFSSNTRGEFTR